MGIAQLLMVVLAVRFPNSPTESSVDLGDAHRQLLMEYWRQYAVSDGAHRDARQALLKEGEVSLEVLLDLLVGPTPSLKLPADERLDELLKSLGAEQFKVRAAATKELRSFGTAVVPFLNRHMNHPELEVRRRVESIWLAITHPQRNPIPRRKLLAAATEIMETSWPLDQLRRVTKQHLDRLAKVETVEYCWSDRPLAPLLASLRHSDSAAERELLADFTMKARPGAAATALGLMPNGLKDRTRVSQLSPWKHVPAHDYSRAIFASLDVTRPSVFKAALYAALPNPKLVRRLHAALRETENEDLRDEIFGFLWHFCEDSVGRDYYFQRLASKDDKQFEIAVIRLTDSKFAYQGPAIIPELSKVLRGDNISRRQLILKQLRNYLGEKSVTLATDEAARFLPSEDPQERAIAQDVLSQLHATRWINVYDRLTQPNVDEKIRAAAAKLGAKSPLQN